ncbi:MAG TPA: PTS sugar transporter subunit IIA [Elusimicrobiota bacterium]|nr:PTS sugar transporter subunit IIA [Elusimicrobiota bacterium]
MRSLLNALQDGRLVELPDTDKVKSLQYLAHLIEAVPEIGGNLDLAEQAVAQENSNNTGIGSGVACPHVRAAGAGDLLCAVGWSPAGIDYGSKDGKKVHLVVMYYIPDTQKNIYLKEVSSLVRAVRDEGRIQGIAKAEDIAKVREELLDWVSAAIDAGIPETKARMIRLEARQAALAGGESTSTQAGVSPVVLKVIPVLIMIQSDDRWTALCVNHELASILEKDSTLGVLLKEHSEFERAGYRFVYRATQIFDPARPLHEYLAIKLA